MFHTQLRGHCGSQSTSLTGRPAAANPSHASSEHSTGIPGRGPSCTQAFPETVWLHDRLVAAFSCTAQGRTRPERNIHHALWPYSLNRSLPQQRPRHGPFQTRERVAATAPATMTYRCLLRDTILHANYFRTTDHLNEYYCRS